MEQVPDFTNSIIITRSFYQERLNRINADPYGTSNRQTNQTSAPASERFLNFVKGKVHGAVATFKKLLDGQTEPSNRIPLLPDSYRSLVISNEKLNGISTLIKETISKPEYQQHYNVHNNRDTDNKKASFLNLINFYKDVSADKIREKMEESNSWIIPEPVKCPYKPVPVYDAQVPAKTHPIARKRRSRKGSHSSQNSSMANLNGKRELHSILSSKEKEKQKKDKDRKRVHFKPEYRNSSSSIIKYTSSDEEEYNEESTDKRVILEEQPIARKDPTLRLSMIAAKKAKINPFQKKNLVEKMSSSQLLREKLAKKAFSGDFYKPTAGKFNLENSFVSDIINDSKIETDSDESGLLHPSADYNTNTAKESKGSKRNKKGYTELSEDSEKSSPEIKAPSPKQFEEPAKLNSPSLGNYEIEEQDMEKEESNHEEQEEEKQEKVPKTTEKPQQTKGGLFSNQPPVQSSLFRQSPPQAPLKLSMTEEKPSSLSPPKGSPEEKLEKPSLFNLNNSSPKETANPVTTIQEDNTENVAVPEIEDLTAQKAPESDNTVEALIQAQKTNYEEALKNPIFANVVSKREEPVVHTNNPFLNPVASSGLGFTSMISGNTAEQSSQLPTENTANTTSNINNNPILGRNQTIGILDILSQNNNANSNSVFSNTLKPVGSYSWLNSNDNNQESKNLFSGFTPSIPQSQPATQGQPGLFGQLFSGGGMNNENSSGIMGSSGNSLFNNSSSGLFGGGSTQNTLGGGLFNGNNGGINSAQSEAMNSNPFLSGMGGGFGSNNQGGGLLRGSTFSLDSGKKKHNQKERAF